MSHTRLLALAFGAATSFFTFAAPTLAQQTTSLTTVATYPGWIRSVNSDWVVVSQDLTSSTTNAFSVINRQTQAIEIIQPAPNDPLERAWATAGGAMFWARAFDSCSLATNLYEWRAGARISLGTLSRRVEPPLGSGPPFGCPERVGEPTVQVKGPWALWRAGDGTLIRRDTTAGTNTVITPSDGLDYLVENGDVVGAQNGAIVRWRNGVVTTIAAGPAEKVASDGVNYAYRVTVADPRPGVRCMESRLWTPSGVETLGRGFCETEDPNAPQIRPLRETDYLFQNGWLAFTSYRDGEDAFSNTFGRSTVTLRAASGARQIFDAPHVSSIGGIEPNGNVIHYSSIANQVYQTAGGGPPRGIGAVIGILQWFDNAWHMYSQGMLQRLSVPTTQPLILAEGATGVFFETDVAILNPTSSDVPVQIGYREDTQLQWQQQRTIPAHTRVTIPLAQQPGLSETQVSTFVEPAGNAPLVVERTMTWDPSGYGGHSGSAVDGHHTRWFFAEGAQGFFDTFFLVTSVERSSGMIRFTFLREGAEPFVREYFNTGGRRWTLHAGSLPELVNRSFATIVESESPIVVERAMYFGSQPLWHGGHESVGVSGLSTHWFHAEGATGPAFDTFILLANVSLETASVQVRFLTDSGLVISRTYTMAGHTRLTIPVETVDLPLAHATFATAVESDVPIVSERAMYWSLTGGAWDEAHNSFGLTTTATKWATSDGRVGGPRNYQTYVLVANPSTTQGANLTATFMREDGAQFTRTFTLTPSRRLTIACNDVLELADSNFGVVVESTNAVPIAVERATYWDANGVTWAGGTNVTATPIP